MENLNTVRKFSPAQYQVMAAEKGTAFVIVDPSKVSNVTGFSGSRGKLIGYENGELVLHSDDKEVRLSKFMLSFGKNVLPAMKSWGSS